MELVVLCSALHATGLVTKKYGTKNTQKTLPHVVLDLTFGKLKQMCSANCCACVWIMSEEQGAADCHHGKQQMVRVYVTSEYYSQWSVMHFSVL